MLTNTVGSSPPLPPPPLHSTPCFPFLFFLFWTHQLSPASGSCVLLFSQPRVFEGSLPLYWWVRPQTVKNLPAIQETQVRSLGQEDCWRREWLPTPVFLPGESQEPNGLSSPWGHKEPDTTEPLTLFLSLFPLCT